MAEAAICTLVNGANTFKPGESFNSFDELKDRMEAHSREDFVYYWLRDSRTVTGAFMKTSRPIEKRLKYYSCRYACVLGGQKFHTRGQGRRNAQSIRSNCPAFVTLRASKCGQKLEVTSVCNTHNHEVSEEFSRTLRHNRKLTPEVRVNVQEMIRMKVGWDNILEYIKLRYDKHLSKKDLFNISGALKNREELTKIDEAAAKHTKLYIEEFIRKQRISEEEIQQPVIETSLTSESCENLMDDFIIEYVNDEECEAEDKENMTIDYIPAATHELDVPTFNTVESNDMELIIEETKGTSNMADDDEYIHEQYFVKRTLDDEQIIFEASTSENFLTTSEITTETYDLLMESPVAEIVEEEQFEIPEPTTVQTKPRLSTVEREILRTKRKVDRCRHCGTGSRLVKRQLQVLLALRRKLKSETDVLRLQKRKLQLEINNLLQV